ncbi:hypothetical protein BH20ACT3_BH20ACT3_08530 [soil metagenome]
MGEYQLQAAIAAVHGRARHPENTDWAQIAALYGLLATMTDNPTVTLNRAGVAAMVEGPTDGLALLAVLEDRLGDHHRLHAVRGHLLAQAGDVSGAVEELRAAAARTANLREQQYLLAPAATLAQGPEIT